MSEPVMGVGICRPPALRKFALLATALSLLGCAVWSAPVLAADAPAADVVYSVESAKASKSLVLDVVHAGKRLVAVGDRGHILYSDDQGATWTQARVPTRQLLTSVFFVDDKHGWAVGHDAQILASEDGGTTWTKQFEDLKRESPLLDVWFQDASSGFAVGAYGALMATTDGGKTGKTSAIAWTTKTSSTSTPSPQSRTPGCSSLASRAACSAPPIGARPGKNSKARMKVRCSV